MISASVTLSVYMYVMLLAFITYMVKTYIPIVSRTSIFQLVHLTVKVVQFICVTIMFFQLPPPSSKVSNMIQGVFIAFVVCICFYIIYHFLQFLLQFIRHKNIRAAMLGPDLLVIDGEPLEGKVEGCVAIKRIVLNGVTRYFWGEHPLLQSPEVIFRIQGKHRLNYKFNSIITEGDCTFAIWKPEGKPYAV